MLNWINKKNKKEIFIKLLNQQKQQKIIEEQKQQQKQKEIFEEEEKQQIYNKININFVLKDVYNNIIPLNLYTCWHTNKLPPLMNENYKLIIKTNPEFNHYIYDENMCRTFLINNFDNSIIESYDKLIPCAFKADLWRYCILYINGGIYIDIKYQCTNNFKLIALTEKEYFVRDYNINNIYNALIVCKPGNEILLKAIRQIVENVKNNFYGNNPLDITSPGLLANYFTKKEKNNLELYHSYTVINNKINEYYIVYSDKIILKFYERYREEQLKNQKLEHYSILWEKKQIYNL
jgi:mannosyltransferase OCH1-like enzyme